MLEATYQPRMEFVVQGVTVAVGSGGAVGHPSGVEAFHCDKCGVAAAGFDAEARRTLSRRGAHAA